MQKEKETAPLSIEEQVIDIVKAFLAELENERLLKAVNLNASLESLGIGSLEKAELFHRIEKVFTVQFSDAAMAHAETVRDIVKALRDASPPSRIVYQQSFPASEASGTDPSDAKTLVETLARYAKEEPDRVHIYLQDEHGHETVIRYGRLFESAVAVAKGLCEYGLKPKDTVAIMLPTCEEFFYAFFGILIAGCVPVPIYPPFQVDKIEDYAKREAKILHNAEVRILISFSAVQTLNRMLQTFIPSLKAVTTVSDLMKSVYKLPDIEIVSEDAALIQYTSGSTGDPKGVLLTHNNLLANLRAVGLAMDVKPTDVAVSWLPLYHDMGLIGSWLGSLYYGVPVTIMSPLSFLNHPERWLWAIHYHPPGFDGGIISGAPNFAYELCVSKIDDKAIEGLDLSRWRIAFNGAEAIISKTMKQFAKRFAPYGFKEETFLPVYGLAESSVGLTFPPLGRKPHVDRISREALDKEQRAIPAKSDEKNYLEFVSCGVPLPDHEIRIMSDDGKEMKERQIGNIEFRGPSSMQGYYRNTKATQAVYHDGWWKTGDLGYKADNELFITGRAKDVIIKAGRNLYPQEIEEITGNIKGIRKGCVAAFGINDSRTGTEKFVIVAETKERRGRSRDLITNEIIENIATHIGIPPDIVILAPPKTIPKTSSGKLRRSACKDAYVKGKLAKRGLPAWLQISKLYATSFWKKCEKQVGIFLRLLYTIYGGIIALVLAIPVFLSVLVFPQKIAIRVCRWLTRNYFRLIGCPFTIIGKNNLKKSTPMVFVSNHASYVDTLALFSVLPPDVAIVGKRELLNTPIVKLFIKKLGHLTVERLDFAESIADANIILTTLKKGRSLLIFPEGTFSYATGLRPFKLGAFKIATETGKPICPIAIQGTRYILRNGQKLPKPGRIIFWIGEPIIPHHHEWRETVRLRSIARMRIAQHCGEQVLDLVHAGPAEQ